MNNTLKGYATETWVLKRLSKFKATSSSASGAQIIGSTHEHANKETLDKLTEEMIKVLGTLSIDEEGHLCSSVGLYSQSFVSAFGLNSSGGSGGGGGAASIIVNGNQYTPNADGVITLPDYPTSLTWSNIQGKPSWIGSTKPTYTASEVGALASNHPASDVTSALIANWNAAYGWGNHASAGYALKDGTGASGTWGISITGNAATATKLQTARTIWGQSFDGTANVRGSLTGVTSITASGTVTIEGNVGIGTTSPSVKLHVVGDIAATGSVTAMASSSDVRLKTDIKNFDAMSIIRSHRSVKYKWNEEARKYAPIFRDNDWHYGLIAQEVKEDMPQFVSDVFKNYLVIEYERLIPICWKGLQEVDDEVENLKKRVAELEEQLNRKKSIRYEC